MGVENNQYERRGQKRFKACSGVFAVNSHFGLIVDICLQGLSFNYIERWPWPRNTVIEKGALFGEDEMWIDSIPIKNISKGKTIKNSSGLAPVIKQRRVVFGQLSPSKKELIKKFISINTRGTE